MCRIEMTVGIALVSLDSDRVEICNIDLDLAQFKGQQR